MIWITSKILDYRVHMWALGTDASWVPFSNSYQSWKPLIGALSNILDVQLEDQQGEPWAGSCAEWKCIATSIFVFFFVLESYVFQRIMYCIQKVCSTLACTRGEGRTTEKELRKCTQPPSTKCYPHAAQQKQASRPAKKTTAENWSENSKAENTHHWGQWKKIGLRNQCNLVYM